MTSASNHVVSAFLSFTKMAASNYYGYTSGVQQSQAYSQVQNPPLQTSYTPQASTAYGVAATGTAATHYGQHQQQAQRQVVQPTYTASAATAAYASQTPGTAYGYTARSQDAPPPPPPSNTSYQHSHTGYATTQQSYYDNKTTYDAKTYYTQQPHSTNVQQQASHNAYYNSGAAATPAKTTYPISAATAYTAPVSAAPVVAKTQPQQSYPQSSVSNVAYPYSASRSQPSHSYNQGGSYSSGTYNQSSVNANAYTAPQQPQAYEAAVYNAASTMFQQQQQQQFQPRQGWKKNPGVNSGGGAGGPGVGSQPPKPMYNKVKKPPAQQQIHFCEVCKISCAGPQTYKEHLDGQRHKKKEAANKKLKDEPVAHNTHRCELCDVTCTGNDAFNAHLKGTKHLKVVKLYQKLGKPIPEMQPVKPDLKKEEKKDDKNKLAAKKLPPKKMVAPKITFVGGTKLASTMPQEESQASVSSSEQDSSQEGDSKMDEDADDDDTEIDKKVGEEFIEEMKAGETGKVTGYHCKLCDCKFNDHNARDAHLGGRRHRLNYKKKVQPDLKVDTKPNSRRVNKAQEDRLRRQWELEMRRRQQEMWRREEEMRWREEELRRWEQQEYWRRMEEEERFYEEEERWRRYEAEYMEWERRQRMAHEFDRYPGPGTHPGMPPRHMDDMPPPPPRPRFDTQDDRQVMAKHASIYPNEQELQAVQNIVSATEKALKLVSDFVAEEDNPPSMDTEQGKVKQEKTEVKTEAPEAKPAEAGAEEKAEKPPQPPRALKGVMRVGVLAKGLLLHQRLDVDLVVLCHDRPTLTLLKRVSENLPVQLQKVTDEKYEVKMHPENSGLTVTSSGEIPVTVTITMTSPVMRENLQPEGGQPAPAEDECDILDKQKCLDALASLRHAKWFQAKANGVQSCVVIIRILRDLCQRVTAFAPLSGSPLSRVKDHAIELLVEKALSSSDHPMGPGEGFRRVLECIASGIFAPGGPGLCDPCEKETTDAAGHMTPQEREDLTAAAQHALRLQVFRQLHKVLGIDPLPQPKMRGPRRGGRFKRRREDNGPDENAKKEKKEGDEASSEKMEVAESTEPKPAETPAKA